MGDILKTYTNVSEVLLAGYAGKRRQLTQLKQSVAGKIAALDKAAKQDGISLDEIKKVIKAQDQSPEEFAQSNNIFVAYARALGLAGSEHLRFIEERADISEMSDADRSAHWFREGSAAHHAGKERADCPHLPETPAAVQWLDGWQRANLQRLEGIAQLAGEDTDEGEVDYPDEPEGEHDPEFDEPEVAGAKPDDPPALVKMIADAKKPHKPTVRKPPSSPPTH